MTDALPRDETSLREKSRTSQTLERGLRVLGCFDEDTPELGVAQLAQTLELAPAIISRLVTTLAKMGYLVQHPSTKKYRLGLGAYLLGLQARPDVHLQQLARPVMERLWSDTGETVSLNVIHAATGQGMCIDSIDSRASIKLTTRIGSVRPLHRGATRKVLLAFLPPDDQARYLAALDVTANARRQLETDLTRIREQGYAYSEGEIDDGAYAIAAPICETHGRLLGGIAIAGPAFRMREEDKVTFTHRVMQAADEVERAFHMSILH